MTHTLRTVEDVVLRVERCTDPFGWEREALVPFLEWREAARYSSDTPETWENVHIPLTVESVLEQARLYLPFAVSRVLNHMSVESARAAIKLDAYCWLLGAERLAHRPEAHPGMLSYPAIAAASLFLVEQAEPRHVRDTFNGADRKVTIAESIRLNRLSKGVACQIGCAECL